MTAFAGPAAALARLSQSATGRPLYIWGAHYRGLALARRLQRLGFTVMAFLDRDPGLRAGGVDGRRVISPDEFWRDVPDGAFLVLASVRGARDMGEVCLKAGLRAGDDFLTLNELQPRNYLVDVSGACNLRCISCPRGNFESPSIKPGFMKASDYRLVLDKIKREDPLTGVITFFDWGEPLLNPDLPEIIAMTRNAGLVTILSTNLNVNSNLERTVKAGPDYLKISASGFGPSYELTHTGGRWDIFLANLKKVKELTTKYSPTTEVELGYHLYRHNLGRDRLAMKELTDGLGIKYRETLAYLSPHENIEAVAQGRGLSGPGQEAAALLLLPIDRALEMARPRRSLPCSLDDHLVITWDMGVKRCCVWFGPEAYIAPPGSYLNLSFRQLEEARSACAICVRCKSEALHRVFDPYNDSALREEILAGSPK
jgi:Predicted Fe-S oxidoreductases